MFLVFNSLVKKLSHELKEIIGIFAVFLAFLAFIPYIWSIFQGKTKPHVFSWIIWGISTLIVFAAQVVSGAGPGAWAVGVSGVITLYIAVLAYLKKSDDSITKLDWIFFAAALLVIPLWYITSCPTCAVIFITIIDVIGFFPTIRKSYHKPHEERVLLYILTSTRNIAVIAALSTYSVATVLFPLAIMILSIALICLILLRRTVLKVSTVNKA